MRMHYFWAQNGPFAKQIFLRQIISNLPISPLHCAKILKILPTDPEL